MQSASGRGYHRWRSAALREKDCPRPRPTSTAVHGWRHGGKSHAGAREVALVSFDEMRASGPAVRAGQTVQRKQQQARIGYERVACIFLLCRNEPRCRPHWSCSSCPIVHPSSSIPPVRDNPWQPRVPPAGPRLPCHASLRDGSASWPADRAWPFSSTQCVSRRCAWNKPPPM